MQIYTGYTDANVYWGTQMKMYTVLLKNAERFRKKTCKEFI